VVDQAALVTALRTKKIACAGLDVFMKEPVDLNDALLQLENVVLSPHIAGGSQEALDSTSMALAEEICRVLDGEAPRNLVNRAQLQKRGFL
jgi:D-3-phosphoglycerate dehydrogenase